MKFLFNILLAFCFFITTNVAAQNSEKISFYSVPAQKLHLYQILGDKSDTSLFHIDSIQISSFITYRQYKEYLASVKKDSSLQFWLSQFPDSNMTSAEKWEKYVNSNKFDNYPVLGISWDNAMNYCKWKTIKDNTNGTIEYIYRLPNANEWLASYYFLQTNNFASDMNILYSDWLTNAYDESAYFFDGLPKDYFRYDYEYYHLNNDPPVLKRKRVIGNSYLFYKPNLEKHLTGTYYYADKGYRHIAYRIVKVRVDNSKTGKDAKWILKRWGVK